MQRTKIKKIAIILSIFLIILILFFFFGEIITRFFHLSKVSPGNTGSIFLFIEKAENLELGYQLKPNSEGYFHGVKVEINSQGLRDNNYSLEKPEGVFRIVVIGDSATFGYNIEVNETYPKILEQTLFKKEEGIEVINFGVTGYNGGQEFFLLKEKVLKYNPNLIIIGHYLNDPDENWNLIKTTIPFPISIKNFLNEHSCFYVFLQTKWKRLLNNFGVTSFTDYKELYKEDSPLWQAHKQRFIEIKEISQKRDIPVLVVILPNWVNLNDSYDFLDEHLLLNKTLNNIGLDFLDMFPLIKGLNSEDYLVTPDDFAHPNYAGQRLISDAIYDRLIERNFYK